MKGAGRYPYLLKPLRLKHLTLRNRIVKAPYSSTGADSRGYVLPAGRDHYEAIAEGGIGLFITESVAVDPLGVSGTPRMAIWDDSFIPGQAQLAATVHRYGTPILMQIHHAGPSYSTGRLGHWSISDETVERLQPLSASTLGPDQLPGPRRTPPRGLTVEEIDALVEKFTLAAERAAAAGFDGVELHFATGFLVNSFFSRAWNKRTDAYGGSIANRARFGCSIVRGIRQRVGDAFIVSARINAVEYGARHEDGLTHAESTEISRLLEDAGVDLLNVTVYGYNSSEWALFPEQVLFPQAPQDMKEFARGVHRGAPLVKDAHAIKAAVSIPVIAVGKLNVSSAERALRRGRADLVAFGRALIADPELPRKVADGRVGDIRPCTHCMTCVDALGRSEHERCRVNAAFAKEQELAIRPTGKKKRVVIVGGGPAGMEAARVAALRGHQVTLIERMPRLGGLVRLAALVKGTEIEELPAFIGYLERQLHQLGVVVRRAQTADMRLIQKLAPDAAIVATGSELALPQIPGILNRNVVTSIDLLKKLQFPMRLLGISILERASRLWLPLGKRVVLVGGQMQGAELAEFLVKRGRQVVMTDSAPELGTGLLEIHRTRLLDWLRANGATLLSGVQYEEITESGLRLVTHDGRSRFLEADNVVVLAVRKPHLALRDAISAFVPEVHLAGDCEKPGMIVDAVEAGYRSALAV